ncbi:MAG: SCO family protein [Pseudomonadota bacterium]
MVLTMRSGALAGVLALGLAGPSLAETGVELPAPTGVPLPFDLGGEFSLVDQAGDIRTQVNPSGRPQLLFFGYAACEQICSVALPMMADAVHALDAAGLDVTPVMITVDPERDTPEVLAEQLPALHPSFIGLTGKPGDLQVAYDAFGVDATVVYEDPFLGDVFAHGSFIYLLDGQGEFLTLFPPILTPDRVTEIVRSHVENDARG